MIPKYHCSVPTCQENAYQAGAPCPTCRRKTPGQILEESIQKIRTWYSENKEKHGRTL